MFEIVIRPFNRWPIVRKIVVIKLIGLFLLLDEVQI